MNTDIVFQELAKLIHDKVVSNKFQKINQDTFKFAANENNHDVLFRACTKVLKKTDPKHTSLEKTERLVKKIQDVAKQMLGV